jgi:hypothetical protein
MTDERSNAMKRTALICLLGFLAGIIAASTLPDALADEKDADEKDAEKTKKLKYPWAGKEWNETVTMTKLDRLLLEHANEAPAEDARVVERQFKKLITVVTKYEAKAARQGILLIAHVKSLRPGDIVRSDANRAAQLWYAKHLNESKDGSNWPIECRLVMKGKVIAKFVRNAD